MEELRGLVEHITYRNEENEYCVVQLQVMGEKERLPAIGIMPGVTEGCILTAQGEYRSDAKYGRQFAVLSASVSAPSTKEGVVRYLGSGLIKGIGPKTARRIVDLLGEEALSRIEEDPQCLAGCPGIGKTRAAAIRESLIAQREIQRVMVFLQSHGVASSYAVRIYKAYGEESIAKVTENPYRLADEIWGIGFATADRIAEQLGMGREKFFRIRSGLFYALERIAESGHCYASREELTKRAMEILQVEEGLVTMTCDSLVHERELIQENVREASAGSASGAASEDTPGQETGQQETEGSGDALERLAGVLTLRAETMEKEAEAEAEEPKLTAAADPVRAVYLPRYFFAERKIAARLSAIAKAPPSRALDAEEAENYFSETADTSYDEVQRKAIAAAACGKVFVLTGGPGTGKTTTTKGIIELLTGCGIPVVLAAPTGRAAKRMSEACGMEAKTIHRLLEMRPPGIAEKNRDNQLDLEALIVDECSMIDTMLMASLLEAVPDRARLILVGDVDQLPSVGAGAVLRDILESDVVPAVCLERIYRQAAGSRIIVNAHHIRRGEPIDWRGGKDSDFFFAAARDDAEAADRIAAFLSDKLPAYYHVDPIREIQVLAPMQRGICGVRALNERLQAVLNPGGDGITFAGTTFRAGDKVMQLRNDYDKEVFNGDIGTVLSVQQEEGKLTALFEGREVAYARQELDELSLAYAATIHKSQGSEYPIVVIPVLKSQYVMLQRNLLYTGVTRAKKILVLVGQREAVETALRNNASIHRNTGLKRRLQDAFS